MDEYDVMREHFCDYKTAQIKLKQILADEAAMAAHAVEREPCVQDVIDMLWRRHSASTLLRLGPTDAMLEAGATAYYAGQFTNGDAARYVWDVMLKEATK